MALICGTGLLGAGIGSVAREAATAGSYERLARTTKLPQDAGEATAEDGESPITARHDWDSLHRANPATGAWLTVDGAAVDLPVVIARDESDQGWYLSHDLWGQASASGTPFMDWRCESAKAPHVCVYAHHMTSSSGMFSRLQGVYEQERFDTLGTLSWETPGSCVRAAPLCALRVDAGWQEIQRFDWDTATTEAQNTELVAWLKGIAAQADAIAPNAEGLLGLPTRCFTLVTCSSELARQRWRTLAIWVC